MTDDYSNVLPGIKSQSIITVVRDPKHTLGKQFSLNSDGKISKHSIVSVAFGFAVMHQVETHEDLAKLLQKVGEDPNAAIINASFDGINIGEEFIILSELEIERHLGIPCANRGKQKGVHQIQRDGKSYKAVGRFKENVSPSTWQCLDRDIDQHTPAQYATLSFEDWVSANFALVSTDSNVSYVKTASTSSRVLLNGAAVGVGNGHAWFQMNNPKDVERFRTAMIVSAAQANMTWKKPRYSRSEPKQVVGQSLTTIFDPSVLTPGRLVFVGQPVVSDGLTVIALSADVIKGADGHVLDTAKLVLPDAKEIRNITRKAGVEMAVRQDGHGLKITANDLMLNTELETESDGIQTVRQLVIRGATGKVRCQTPFRDSSSFAAFYSVNAEGQPFVYDVGTGITHWLQASETSQFELSAALRAAQGIVTKVKDDCGAPFESEAISALATVKAASTADYQRIRAEIKAANKGIPLVALDAAIKKTAASNITASTHHGYAISVLESLAVDEHKPVGFEGSLFCLDPASNLWVRRPLEELARLVAEAHDGNENCERCTDYNGIAQHIMTLSANDEFFATAPVGLVCPDGFYQIQGAEVKVEPLMPSDRQRVKLDVMPDELLPIPLFLNFLHETFMSDNDDEEVQQIMLVQEIAGATMLGVMYKFQKAVKWYDPFGRAGKGTLERIVRKLVPSKFITAVSPFVWDKEYFVASLAGSRLNVVGELPDDKSIPAADFKSITGGDLVTGRHPTHRPITFRNEAAHLFMSNHLINTKDHSEAFFARWIIVEFPNSRLRNGLPLDADLPDRIISAELPGIVHWALEGAVRLMAKGAFTKSFAHDRLMAKWRRTSNSLEEFIHDRCVLGADMQSRRSEFYSDYVAWCKDSGRHAFAKGRVKELLEHNIGLGISLKEINGYETFRGVQVRLYTDAKSYRDS